ncbi:MFS transporter [Marinomonas ostreistagni]|uniref:MFS transporter n=1 Tax=Marinomonas ostreistagni TaxID=359209 RepID=A0ABS0ZEB9_9GAMM|nr:MFS transporter [Marinomonas ostreistagni]MBJ7552017.1 MFS transporter [Marinomonas ostreistagni]
MKIKALLYTHFSVSLCNFMLTAMTIYLYLGMPLAMRQNGWSGAEIGAFQLAGIPVLLKFLMAAPIERFVFKKSNYFKWACFLGAGTIVGLVCLSQSNIEEVPFIQVFLCTLVTSIFATWVDIPVNAIAIRTLPQKEQVRSGAFRSSVSALASIIGGGIMIFVYGRFGWEAPIYLFMIGIALSLLMLFPVEKETAETATASSQENTASYLSNRVETSISTWKGYFLQPDKVWWNIILVSYFPFVGCAWLFLKPTLLDHGLKVDEIAWLATIGGIVAALAGFLYALLLKKVPGFRALFWVSGLNLIALYLMLHLSHSFPHGWQLVATVSVLALSLGLSSGLVLGLIMAQSRKHHEAIDYGIQSSLFSLSRMLVPAVAGVLLDYIGYQGMFTALLLGALSVTLVTYIAMRSYTEAVIA